MKNKTYNLFLDDERDLDWTYYFAKDYIDAFNPNDYLDGSWVVVRSYRDFCKVISEHGLPEKCSLDHDLGLSIYSGYDCVKWLVEYCMNMEIELTTEFRYHTSNPIGQNNMRAYINNFKKYQQTNE